jgi:hypothetical protein
MKMFNLCLKVEPILHLLFIIYFNKKNYPNLKKKKMSGIFEYNGGSIVGMKGKNCIGIACDRRFG